MRLADPLFTINGLPLHPLLVHVVVVLIPLGAIGAIAIALFPPLRRRFWLPVLIVTYVGVIAIPFTQQAGQQLLDHLGPLNNPDLQRHVGLGNGLLPYGVVFAVVVLILVIAGGFADHERWRVKEEPSRPSVFWRIISIIAAIAVIVAAVTVVIQVVLTGDAGSAAVWKGIAGG